MVGTTKDDEISNEIHSIMKILCISWMPSVRELRSISRQDLDNKITRSGGYSFWASKLNLLTKKDYKTKEKIEEVAVEIKRMIKELSLDRMPTKQEIISYFGNATIANRACKMTRLYDVANELGVPIKQSETFMGYNYQQVCAEQLITMGYKVEKMSSKHPYDLLVNDNVKIDVKSGCAYHVREYRTHTFGMNKVNPTCDIYILYALNETGNEIERIFIIPSKLARVSTLSVGTISYLYDRHVGKWDWIDTYDNFYNSIK